MGNVNMEAKQIHDRTEAGKHQSVADHLKALDALAQQIEDMPAYTSSDRAWLDEWERKLPELPANPVSDGVKVLTATTSSGETVISWEEPSTTIPGYSTIAINTGKKWIDGTTDVKRIVYAFDTPISIAGSDWVDTGIPKGSVNRILDIYALNANAHYPLVAALDQTDIYVLQPRSDITASNVTYIVMEFTQGS